MPEPDGLNYLLSHRLHRQICLVTEQLQGGPTTADFFIVESGRTEHKTSYRESFVLDRVNDEGLGLFCGMELAELPQALRLFIVRALCQLLSHLHLQLQVTCTFNASVCHGVRNGEGNSV